MSAFLPYQADWYADAAKLRVCEKSRRIGITWAEAARQVLLAARRRDEGGMNCSYLSTSHRLARKYIATCAHWARELGQASAALGETMIADAGRDILVHEIRFASGHVVQALASNPESMRGEGGDVVIDEAAHHADLDELLKAARAVGDWGGRLTLISTHNGKDNPFNVLCEDLRTRRRRGSLHRVTIHDALAAGLYRRRCEVDGSEYSIERENEWLADALSSWGSDEEYLVIPSASGGVYIRSDLIEECADARAQIVRLELPANHMHRADRAAFIAAWCAAELGPLLAALPRDLLTTIGYDFARSGQGDLSVMALLTERRDLVKACPWLVEMRGVPFEEQWQIFKFVAERIRRFGGAAIDGGGNGSWLGETALVHFGPALVTVVNLQASWYSENMPRFRSAFEEHQITVPADVDVRDDLLMFSLNSKGVPTLGDHRRRDSKDRKPRHGDAAIALALAHSRHRDTPQEVEFRRVERWPKAQDERRTRLRRGGL